jgi:hypothetical protein
MSYLQDILYKKVLPRLGWLLPKALENFPVAGKIFQLLEYDLWRLFAAFNCSIVLNDHALCSARTAGVR